MIRGRAVEAWFAAGSLEEQADIWQRRFDDRLWRGSIRMLGRRWFRNRVIVEPGGAFTRASGAFLFRESDFASLILRGTNALPAALPLHLLAQNFDRVRSGFQWLQIVDGGLIGLLEAGAQDVDGFALSDPGS